MGSQSQELILTNMKTFGVLVALTCLAAFVSAEPRYKKLQKTNLSCTVEELMRCEAEIQQALADCSHITDAASFQTCLNDILGAADCIKCICDVDPYIPIICP